MCFDKILKIGTYENFRLKVFSVIFGVEIIKYELWIMNTLFQDYS